MRNSTGADAPSHQDFRSRLCPAFVGLPNPYDLPERPIAPLCRHHDPLDLFAIDSPSAVEHLDALALRRWLLDWWPFDVVALPEIRSHGPLKGLTVPALRRVIRSLEHNGWLAPVNDHVFVFGNFRRQDDAWRVVREPRWLTDREGNRP